MMIFTQLPTYLPTYLIMVKDGKEGSGILLNLDLAVVAQLLHQLPLHHLLEIE